jgi:hypothetical protein
MKGKKRMVKTITQHNPYNQSQPNQNVGVPDVIEN